MLFTPTNLNNISVETLSQALNRAIKEQRGTARPFVAIVVEQDGAATVASNMTVRTEVLELMAQVSAQMRSS